MSRVSTYLHSKLKPSTSDIYEDYTPSEFFTNHIVRGGKCLRASDRIAKDRRSVILVTVLQSRITRVLEHVDAFCIFPYLEWQWHSNGNIEEASDRWVIPFISHTVD